MSNISTPVVMLNNLNQVLLSAFPAKVLYFEKMKMNFMIILIIFPKLDPDWLFTSSIGASNV